MITVTLIAKPEVPPVVSARQAAETCYQAVLPKPKPNDEATAKFVKDKLFNVGHHTTLQHQQFTFAIEGIAVGDVTLGLHLAHPFYDSDQRSGRFCSAMFDNPDPEPIRQYISFFWPEITDQQLAMTLNQVEQGLKLYRDNLGPATELAERFLRQERPHLKEEAILVQAAKIAQEQLRMFIPVIFPTGLQYTVNLSALVAVWQSAFTPVLRYVTDEMRRQVLSLWPELDFMFDGQQRRKDDWYCDYDCVSGPPHVDPMLYWNTDAPNIKAVRVYFFESTRSPAPSLMHPLDLLHFTPELMGNNTATIIERGVTMSLATMGQDQRHRAIRRSEPHFTAQFYLPPLVSELVKAGKLELTAIRDLFRGWQEMYYCLPSNLKTLWMVLAPYGAVVEYDKVGSLNAIAHEQAKRLCWCAQEEIFHLGLRLRALVGKTHPRLLALLDPPCFKNGVCGEGTRYCGRDLRLRSRSEDFFCRRRV